MTSSARPGRREVLAGGIVLVAGIGAGLKPLGAAAQATTALPQPDSTEADRIAAGFLNGAEPLSDGLALDLPALGDNPAAVPVRVHVTEAISDSSWCEEIILIADLNPRPFACRFRFTAATGSADVAVRLRLIQSMPIRAYARMNDGRMLAARQDITVAAGGCGL